MFGRAVDVVSRNAVNPDFLPDEDKSTPQLDLLARVERELPVRLDQERTDMVVCHGELQKELGVIVIDGVAAAVKQAEMLVQLNLKTSKIGDWASPPVKNYTGILSGFGMR